MPDGVPGAGGREQRGLCLPCTAFSLGGQVSKNGQPSRWAGSVVRRAPKERFPFGGLGGDFPVKAGVSRELEGSRQE